MTGLRATLPPLPKRMRGRPIDHRGFPVPFFVTSKDEQGRWEFRTVQWQRQFTAIKRKVCWICGEPLGRMYAFAIGPMCCINRVSADPPQHRECAEFAAQACPFLVEPKAVRREQGIEHLQENGPGLPIRRNPGVIAIWVTRSYRLLPSNGAYLHRLGDPVEVTWWCHGRKAEPAEIGHSVATGLPFLQETAAEEGEAALDALAFAISRAQPLFPCQIG